MINESFSIMIGGDFAPSTQPVSRKPLWDKQLSTILEKADFRVINLEGPLTKSNLRRPKIGVALKASPDYTSYLKQNHIDMLSLANNHIFDFDIRGVFDTIESCEKHGVFHAGIASRSIEDSLPVFYITIRGKRIGFYCLAEHEFNYKDDFSISTVLLEPARNILDIQRARKECDSLIVFSHIGPEHTAYPSPRMVSLFHCFAEAGASAIVNSHAHHVMGMEHYHGIPIFYGLGNLYFNMENKVSYWREGMFAQLEWHDENGFKGTPVFTSFDSKAMRVSFDFSPHRLEEFQRISQLLLSPVELDVKWNDFCLSQRKHILKECAKGVLAMLPNYIKSKLTHQPIHTSQYGYFAKGARMLRGMFQCENHSDVLARIFRELSRGGC